MAESEELLQKKIEELSKELNDLKSKESSYKHALENSIAGVYIIQNGDIVYANPFIHKMFGYNKDDIIGKMHASDFIHPDYHDKLTENLKLREEGAYDDRVNEYKFIKKDGSTFIGEVYSVPSEFNGKPSITGSLFDITERKKKEEALKASEETFSRVFDHSPTIMLLGNLKTREYYAVNKNYYKATLLEENEKVLRVPGKLGSEAVDPDKVELIIDKLMVEDRVENIEYQAYSANGEIRDVIINGEAFDADGERLAVFNIIDVTDMKKIRKSLVEKERLHMEQLQQADKMASLGVLVSGVAHEVNNPNNFIMLNTPILKDMWESSKTVLDEYYKENKDFKIGGIKYSKALNMIPELFEGIHDGAKRIKVIVEDLKNFARKDICEFNNIVNVNCVVKEAVSLLKSLISKSTKNFNLSLPENPLHIRGNKQKLEQVIINLIQNGCEALESSEQNLTVTIFSSDLNCIIEIRDEGKGISEIDMPHLMDPFFTTRRTSGGTGLGLSVSAGIVKDHKGELTFESTIGKGTTAKVILPLAEGEAAIK